jgi:DNA (cytosine-5)-methyltransferase 1
MAAWYNEIDPFAAAWLRELIREGHIADGVVDERSIADVAPTELSGFAQCHFFAGIGVWSYALRQAGWPDDRPVWTGSCPCQPFSAAGGRAGFDDVRHVWPFWHWLISQCRPPIVIGEQVASADGLGWLDLVSADLEGTDYAFGAADLCAAGVGAPHIRQRLWFVAHAGSQGLERRNAGEVGRQRSAAERGGEDGRLADADLGAGRQGRALARGRDRRGDALQGTGSGGDGELDRLADAGSGQRPGAADGFWRDADWLYCRDGRWRPVESGTFPLVAGIARSLVRGSHTSAPINANATAEARVMRLRGYGNSINLWAAVTFIEAVINAGSVQGAWDC